MPETSPTNNVSWRWLGPLVVTVLMSVGAYLYVDMSHQVQANREKTAAQDVQIATMIQTLSNLTYQIAEMNSTMRDTNSIMRKIEDHSSWRK